jgi:DivIVA domain-containing protein
MALSPEDVRNTMFGTTRMRTGYDMDEVDAFLDVIESDLIRRSEEVQRALEAEEAMRAQNTLLNAHVRELEEQVVTLKAALAEADAASTGQVDDRRHTEPLLLPASDDVNADEAGEGADASVAPRQPGTVRDETAESQAVLSLAQQAADEIILLAQTRADVIRAEVRDMLASQLALVPERAVDQD